MSGAQHSSINLKKIISWVGYSNLKEKQNYLCALLLIIMNVNSKSFDVEAAVRNKMACLKATSSLKTKI